MRVGFQIVNKADILDAELLGDVFRADGPRQVRRFDDAVSNGSRDTKAGRTRDLIMRGDELLRNLPQTFMLAAREDFDGNSGQTVGSAFEESQPRVGTAN